MKHTKYRMAHGVLSPSPHHHPSGRRKGDRSIVSNAKSSLSAPSFLPVEGNAVITADVQVRMAERCIGRQALASASKVA